MDTLTPEEARRRFGPLLDAPTRTFVHFDDPAGGVWRPVLVEGELVRYQLQRLHKLPKRLSVKHRRR